MQQRFFMCHDGRIGHTGHYTAFEHHAENRRWYTWYSFNDKEVLQVAPHVANSGLTTGAGYYYSTDIWSKLQLLQFSASGLSFLLVARAVSLFLSL